MLVVWNVFGFIKHGCHINFLCQDWGFTVPQPGEGWKLSWVSLFIELTSTRCCAVASTRIIHFSNLYFSLFQIILKCESALKTFRVSFWASRVHEKVDTSWGLRPSCEVLPSLEPHPPPIFSHQIFREGMSIVLKAVLCRGNVVFTITCTTDPDWVRGDNFWPEGYFTTIGRSNKRSLWLRFSFVNFIFGSGFRNNLTSLSFSCFSFVNFIYPFYLIKNFLPSGSRSVSPVGIANGALCSTYWSRRGELASGIIFLCCCSSERSYTNIEEYLIQSFLIFSLLSYS